MTTTSSHPVEPELARAAPSEPAATSGVPLDLAADLDGSHRTAEAVRCDAVDRGDVIVAFEAAEHHGPLHTVVSAPAGGTIRTSLS